MNGALMLVIPGPEELLIAGFLVKVGGKVGPKTISWGANKFGAKGAAKKASGAVDDISWSLNKDGATINGRKYSGHALERMAPDTPEIRAQLNTRAQEIAKSKGYVPGTKDYSAFMKKYIQPRNIPPTVIEDAISNGVKTSGNQLNTWKFEAGDVITVIPK
ncbi:hypothetical protein [Listeria monocytogenes]|nr:hypothetical protein [Listeria monocytogenes]